MSAAVKPGYKQTELGIIPEEWEIIPLAEVVTEFRGGAPLKPNEFTTSGIKVLPKGGVGRTGWLQVKVDEFQYCSPRYAAAHRNNQVDETYTIVVLRDLVPSGPSIGLIVQIKEAETYVLAQGVYGFKVNDQAEPRYLIQLSNTRWYRQLMNSIMVGSTQVHITNSAFKYARIPLPPPPEQRAIATALSDVDGLLGGLDRLIAKKRDLKQAAMQQLLTGQTRLPGFHGEWEVKRLGDVATLHRLNVVPASWPSQTFVHFSLPAFDAGKAPVVELGSAIGSNKFRVPQGAVLVSKLNPRIPRVWAPDDIPEESIASTEFLVLIPKDGVSRRFLFILCASPRFCEQMELTATGTTGSHQRMSPSGALTLKVFVPTDAAEQTAIAEVLTEMDRELAVLEQRREKTRALKQAMMQELLTGRTRLV